MTYHSLKRHFISPDVNMSPGLTSLLDSFVLRENGKFHESKVTLWKWLRDETSNGHTYYAFCKEAALDSIIYRLLESMPEVLQLKFDCAIISDPMTCGAGVQQATKVINQPDLFLLGTHSNSTIGYTQLGEGKLNSY